MVVRLLQYVRATGAIHGLWESSVAAHLQAQMVADDPVYAYLEMEAGAPEADLPTEEVLTGWYVADATLRKKAVLTITALPPIFAADGQTECLLTVAPCVPCTLLVHGVPYVLTEDDPVLVLTSDVPETFDVRLQPMARYRAEPLRVEAR